MVKCRYLWLFVFGYVIAGENEGKNSISLDISRSTQQYTLKTMPDHIFEENLNNFKKITGYKECEFTHNPVLKKSPVIERKEQPSNTKNNNDKKKKQTTNNNNSQTQVSTQNLTKKIIALQMNQQPSSTKNNNNKKKKNKKKNSKKSDDIQFLDQAIAQNKRELWEKKEERTFTEDVNDMVLSYQLYKERSLDPKFNYKKGPLLLSFLDIVGILLDEEELTKKEQRIKKEELLPLYEQIKQESVIWCDNVEESSFDYEN